jgi:hypothetical protein
MLSPHEIAALMLIQSADESIQPDRDELDALLRLELVIVEPAVPGCAHPRVTARGEAVLRAIAGSRAVPRGIHAAANK